MASSTRKGTAKTKATTKKKSTGKKSAKKPTDKADLKVVPPKEKADSKNPKKKKKKKPPPVVTVREDYCKGCGICVAFCPTDTLGFKAGQAFVAHPETCIGCNFCELRCPDFAITVEEKNGGA